MHAVAKAAYIKHQHHSGGGGNQRIEEHGRVRISNAVALVRKPNQRHGQHRLRRLYISFTRPVHVGGHTAQHAATAAKANRGVVHKQFVAGFEAQRSCEEVDGEEQPEAGQPRQIVGRRQAPLCDPAIQAPSLPAAAACHAPLCTPPKLHAAPAPPGRCQTHLPRDTTARPAARVPPHA